MLLLIFIKTLLSPLLVIGSWLAGRLLGPAVGGRIAALPMVGGPILWALYIQQGEHFAVSSAKYALLGILPLSMFGVIYSWASKVSPHQPRVRRIGTSLVAGWLGFVLVAACLLTILHALTSQRADTLSIWICMGVAAGSLLFSPYLLANVPEDQEPITQQSNLEEVCGRALGAMILVGTTSSIARFLGPEWSGIFTSFPAAISVVVVFTNRSLGPLAIRPTIEGYLHGLFGFLAFLSLFAWALPSYGLLWTACISLPAAILVQLIHYLFQMRRHTETRKPRDSTTRQQA